MPPGLPMVSADRTRFVQILIANFASNAIKYNRPSGKVTFHDILAHAGPHPSRRARLRDRNSHGGSKTSFFSRFNAPAKRRDRIGADVASVCVITKRLAQLMNGDVSFRGEAGGSEFWVDIPAHASGVVRAASPAAAPALKRSS